MKWSQRTYKFVYDVATVVILWILYVIPARKLKVRRSEQSKHSS